MFGLHGEIKYYASGLNLLSFSLKDFVPFRFFTLDNFFFSLHRQQLFSLKYSMRCS